MAWKNVQYENGKLRTSSGGSGGSSNFADLEDVDLSNLQNGQVPKYNATTGKWENANESGGSTHTYSTTEQVVGTWIDGKPVYEKVIAVSLTSTGNTDIAGVSNMAHVVSIIGSVKRNDGVIKTLPYANTSVSQLNLLALTDILADGTLRFRVGDDYNSLLPLTGYVVIQYTKTTD